MLRTGMQSDSTCFIQALAYRFSQRLFGALLRNLTHFVQICNIHFYVLQTGLQSESTCFVLAPTHRFSQCLAKPDLLHPPPSTIWAYGTQVTMPRGIRIICVSHVNVRFLLSYIWCLYFHFYMYQKFCCIIFIVKLKLCTYVKWFRIWSVCWAD